MDFRPKARWDIHLNQSCVSDIMELMIFLPNDTILLRGVRKSGIVDNVMIHAKCMDRGLDRLESVIGMTNLWPIEILSDNFRDEVGDHSDNLKAIVEKVDPTHTVVVIVSTDTIY